MAQAERVELFDRRSGGWFVLLLLFIASLSLSYDYYHYLRLTAFDDPLVRAEVISQEVRLIYEEPKTAMKFRLKSGATVRAQMSPYVRDLRGREVLIELKVKNLTFLEYLKGFKAHGDIYEVYPGLSLKERWYRSIAMQHEDSWMRELYGALFVATPMSQELQNLIGGMGLSAAISISGYHFGILSVIAFFILRPAYGMVQSRYFPYRHGRRDLYVIVLLLLGFYLWALEFNPAMVRSFGMIVIGFWLYDRGIKIVSFQTLALTVGILLAFFPKLFFSLAFWFSAFGVLLIFLFIRYFEHWRAWQIFLGLNVWLYVAMLPISLSLFGTFGWVHAGSIGLNILFNLYYPLVLILHAVQWGELLDSYVIRMFESSEVIRVSIPEWTGWMSVFLALCAMRYKTAFWLLAGLSLLTFGYAIYQIA